MQRCDWPKTDLEIAYHDTEWGVPCHDDTKLFEYIVLDTFQAGLSWSMMLDKREGFREIFHGFDPKKIAVMSDEELDAARENKAIVRNKLKIYATRSNAQAFLAIQKEYGSFDSYIWRFVENTPIQNVWQTNEDIPTTSAVAERLSADMKSKGFKFVGPTVIYALMQGIGMVNDHLVSCYRNDEVILQI